MALLLWVWMAAVPLLLGKGAVLILYRKEAYREFGWTDALVHGICVEIGIGEALHLAAVFLGRTLTEAAYLWFAVTALACALAAALAWLLCRGERRKKNAAGKHRRENTAGERWKGNAAGKRAEAGNPLERWLFIMFGLAVVLQVVILLTGRNISWEGDMTLEAVRSFLSEDGIYRINPLTGAPYEGGLPLRIEILSLPTLYAFLNRLSGVDPGTLLGSWVSALVLLVFYAIFSRLGDTLFGKDRTKKALFLCAAVILLQAGDYMVPMDGFQLLHCGYRGTAIRAGILLPYTVDLCLRKKWQGVVLCVLAEACIVWTFYGLGACLLTAGFFLLPVILRRLHPGKEAAV